MCCRRCFSRWGEYFADVDFSAEYFSDLMIFLCVHGCTASSPSLWYINSLDIAVAMVCTSDSYLKVGTDEMYLSTCINAWTMVSMTVSPNHCQSDTVSYFIYLQYLKHLQSENYCFVLMNLMTLVIGCHFS